ncbi:MAG TPA: hypothetical protein VG368_02605, partial [Acidimicrobiales bacterium]|nr:hypothetical protein [Acidimicrobiales bacterium]
MSSQRRSGSPARPSSASNTTTSRPQGGGPGRRPAQPRATRIAAPAQRSIEHRTIDPWAPASSGTFRALVARLAPLLLVALGAVVATLSLVPGVVILGLGAALLAMNEHVANPRHVLERLGGRVIAPHEQPGLRNIVEGLCVASGQAVPEIRILHEDAPNALLLYRRKGEAVLLCTSGLL